MTVSEFDLHLIAIVVIFSLTALGCFMSLIRVRKHERTETQNGLSALLITTGLWALAYIGFYLSSRTVVKSVFYLGGLLIGFSTVFAWLYFASAYSNRQFHKQRTIRATGVGFFFIVAGLKLTNPLHGQYFSLAQTQDGIVLTHGPVHFLSLGIAYVLAAVGIFMITERLLYAHNRSWPMFFLIGCVSVPAILEIVSQFTSTFDTVLYSPLGVAVFGIGVAFVVPEEFEAGQAGYDSDPYFVLTADNEIYQYNRAAAELFPALSRDDIGEPVTAAVPELGPAVTGNTQFAELHRSDGVEYHRISITQQDEFLSNGIYSLALTDVTAEEQYRQQLLDKTERLERLAAVLSHDLRNPLQVIHLNTQSLQATSDPTDEIEAIQRATTRIETLTETLLTIARADKAALEFEEVRLRAAVENAWETVPATDTELVITFESDPVLKADRSHLLQLLENLFRNTEEHATPGPAVTESPPESSGNLQECVTVRVGIFETGFYIEDNGQGLPEKPTEELVKMGYSVKDHGNGLGLSIVSEVADLHGWDLNITDSRDGGARFEFGDAL